MIWIILNLSRIVLQPIIWFSWMHIPGIFGRDIYYAVDRGNTLWWQVCLYYLCSSVSKWVFWCVPAFNFFIIVGFQEFYFYVFGVDFFVFILLGLIEFLATIDLWFSSNLENLGTLFPQLFFLHIYNHSGFVFDIE